MNRDTQYRSPGWFSWTLVTLAVAAFSAAPSSAQVHDTTLKGSGTNTSPLG
jgi:hypothetical protein